MVDPVVVVLFSRLPSLPLPSPEMFSCAVSHYSSLLFGARNGPMAPIRSGFGFFLSLCGPFFQNCRAIGRTMATGSKIPFCREGRILFCLLAYNLSLIPSQTGFLALTALSCEDGMCLTRYLAPPFFPRQMTYHDVSLPDEK